MKCPKCGYLGFEHVDRCRHCGYEFSLTSTLSIPDITFRDEPIVRRNPLDDPIALIDDATPPPPDIRLADAGLDLDRLFGEADPPAPPPDSSAPAPRQSAARAAPRQELMLVSAGGLPDDEPLITKASPPRPPLSTYGALHPKCRDCVPSRALPSLDLALDSDPQPTIAPRGGGLERHAAAQAAGRGLGESAAARVCMRQRAAAMGARLFAVVIDLLILAAVDAVVIYFTMQICGLSVTMADVGLLPKGPLLAFLIVQNGGYLVAFTAGGQTLGKMVAGILASLSADSGRVASTSAAHFSAPRCG